MKNISLILFLLMSQSTAHAQFVNCETMPLAVTSVFNFDTNSIQGDAAIVFKLTNASGTNFAYPQVKLEPITPFPVGMNLNSINPGWAVFASAWNDGDTATVNVYYDVTTPIAPNYMVDLLLYVTNFNPLTIDSCVFIDTMRVNLNPTAQAGFEIPQETLFKVYPNPAIEYVDISLNKELTKKWFEIYNLQGELVQSVLVTQQTRLDLSHYINGMYLIKSRGGYETFKLLVQH